MKIFLLCLLYLCKCIFARDNNLTFPLFQTINDYEFSMTTLINSFPESPTYGFVNIYSQNKNNDKSNLVMIQTYLLNECMFNSETLMYFRYHCSMETKNILQRISYSDSQCLLEITPSLSSLSYDSEPLKILPTCYTLQTNDPIQQIPLSWLVQSLFDTSSCQHTMFLFAYPTYQCLSFKVSSGSKEINNDVTMRYVTIYNTNSSQYTYYHTNNTLLSNLNKDHCWDKITQKNSKDNNINNSNYDNNYGGIIEYSYNSTCLIDKLDGLLEQDYSTDPRNNDIEIYMSSSIHHLTTSNKLNN